MRRVTARRTMPLVPTTYAGATARLLPDAGLRLDPDRWAWQPKVDGCYATIATGDDGRIASVLSRTGHPLREGADLLGILAGPPRSVMVGELEAHTEAGIAAARSRGWAALHLFDTLALAGQSLAARPYLARYAALSAAQLYVAQLGADHVASWVERPVRVRRDPHRPGRHARRLAAIDPATGAFAARVPRDLRRLPIVPLVRGTADALALWSSHVEAGGGEGLVAVRLNAPVGARSAKRKIKLTDTAEAVVLDVSPDAVRLSCPRSSPAGWRGESFVVGCRLPLRIGQVVEVAHDGCYADGRPRFARVVRRRADLVA